MKKFYAASKNLLAFRFLLPLVATMVSLSAVCQTTVTTAVPASLFLPSYTEQGVVVFGVKNTNAFPITITKLSQYIPANYEGKFTLWYKTSVVSGAPGAITPANGWTPLTDATPFINGSTAGVFEIFSSLKIVIPANTTFRFGLQASIEGPYYGGAATTADVVTGGGVELHSQASTVSPTYAGTYPSGVTNNPRGFYGSITFINNPAPVANNASAYSINAPVDFCVGSQDVKVKIVNNGSNIINNVTVNWELDGIVQTPINYSTPIDVAGSVGGNEAIVTLGNVSFTGKAKTLRVWTSQPNGVADAVPGDDEFQIKIQPKLNGNYTIGGPSPDFANFSEAVAALYAGICGPVTFNVAANSGPYTEQLTIPIVRGSSAANRVRFLGNGNTIQYTATTAARHIIKLLGADFITLDSLRIVSQATDFGWGIHLKNGANNDSIKNCVIDISVTASTTAGNTAGIAASNSTTSPTTIGDNASNLTVYNCEIIGAYRGISLYGNTDAANASNNKVVNCIVRDFYADGILVNNQTGALIQGNNIHRMNRTGVTTFTGIELSGATKSSIINANRIHDTHNSAITTSGAAYGISSSSNDAVAGTENKVTNNLVYNFNSATGTIYGLFNTGSDGVFYYHNTIALDHPSSTAGITRGFYQTTAATGIELKNNIFYITRGGSGVKYALYFNTTTSSIISDHNVFHIGSTAGTNGVGFYSTGYATLATWKNANTSAYDQNSTTLDPLFANPGAGDYTPTETALNGIGTNVGVTTDILGNPRSTTPDPGAYEITVSGLDAAITWIAPVNPSTAGLKTVTVRINNTQTTTINSLNLSYTDGGTTQTQTFTGLSIAPGTAQQLSFSTQYNLTQSARLQAYISLVNGVADNNQLNDTTAVQNLCLLLAGNYTINKLMPTAGTNFNSFNDAVSQLICSGISGPVVFTVEPTTGPYDEQVTIPEIAGASAVNRITFKGNGEILQFTPVSANRHIIKLDGADYINIDSLTIKSLDATYGWGIHLTNGANYDSIRNCVIDMLAVTSTTEDNSGCIIGSGSATDINADGNANHNVIYKNELIGGYHTVIINGGTGALNAVSNRVINNTIRDFYFNGVELTDNDSALIAHNDIHRMNRVEVTTFEGVELGSGNQNCVVDGNFIHDTHTAATTKTAAAYAVFSTADDAPAGSPNKVINNVVYNFNSTGGAGTIYALYNSSSNGVYYYHNTIVLDDASSTATGVTRGFYQTTLATDIELKNNIFYIARGGAGVKYALYFGTTTSSIISDNNVLYNISPSGTNGIGSYGTTGYADLAAWKTANGGVYDQQSISEDPLFVSPPTDFTPSQPLINDIGANVGVLTDILGVARPASPDPGAYEFSLPGCNNPPLPGNATTSDMTACSGSSFTLDLINNSVGSGQVYQWQSSPDNVNFTNIGTSQTTTAFTTSQTVTTYYRAAVTCNAGTTLYSASVLVTTPGLVSGTFTINNTVATGGSNFQSFADAVNHIKCGINGPVVFNVAAGSGPYNEQVIMPAIPGTSSINTITINGRNSVVTYLSTNAAERAVIKLNGTDYVKIDSLVIDAQGSATTEYAYGVQLLNDADNNTIKNCTINVNTSATSTANFAGIVINSSASPANIVTGTGASLCDSNLIEHNTIAGGYAGIAVIANGSTSMVYNNKIINNRVTDFYEYGIVMNGNVNGLIEGNDVSRPTRSAPNTFRGISLSSINMNTRISKNRIHTPFGGNTANTNGAFAIYITGCRTTAGNEVIVSNNMVYDFVNGTSGNPNHNGALVVSSDHIKFYYNSILLDDASSTCTTCGTRGFYMQTAPFAGLEFKNNIVKISRAGTGPKQAIYFEGTGVSFTSDYNDYFIESTGGTIQTGFANGTGYTTLTDWQQSPGTPDLHSFAVAPLFVSPTDLHLQPSSPLDDQGTYVAAVVVDIDDEVRAVSSPDIGADELPPSVGIDMRPSQLISPADNNGCYNTETITVEVKNNSTGTINFVSTPVTVNVNVTGAATASYSALVNTGTLTAGGVQNVTMTAPSATINMSTPGIYTFTISTSVAGDVNTGNDQLIVAKEKIALSAGVADATPDSYCVTGGTPTLTATGVLGNATFKWQESLNATTGYTDVAGGTVNPFTLASPITQTRYYRLLATCGSNTVTSNIDSVVLNNPMVTSTTPATRCGSGTLTLGATTNSTGLNWYANATGGTPIGSGNSFTTPLINNTTTYYVAANSGYASQVYSVGIPGNPERNYITQTTGWGNHFTVSEQCTLNSVSVYPDGTGTITILILDPSNNLLYSSPVANVTGTGYTGSPVVVPVNITLAPGNYKLGQSSTGITSLGAQQIGTIAYPFTSPALTITSGAQGGAPVANVYYWFYDWKVGVTVGCEGPRTAVTATVDNDPGCTPMPVTLLSFTGEKQGTINKLSWITTTEVNNAGFELERSADGKNFSKIAFVASQADGNSNQVLNYVYFDERPLAGNGYYRLKQVDKDGKFTYSNIVLIKGSKVKEIMITSLYPNPAESEVNVIITSPVSERVTLVVTDMTGKVVNRTNVQLSAGDNLQKLQVSHLASGTYFIKTICANGCESPVQKFVKQ